MRNSILFATMAIALNGHAQAATLADMKGDRRVVLIAAADKNDPRLVTQRHLLSNWRQGAAERDVSIIEVIGGSVSGSDDSAATLRRRLALPSQSFAVVLIGKDGTVALRASAPLSAQRLQSVIEAMPMRMAGQR